MLDNKELSFYSQQLIAWYTINKRDLPWRETTNAYHIWLSEIILQQTRVAQGLDYYLRFVEAFPTVQSLANAPEDEVLKLWQGLGYYSRARNLHAAAKDVVQKFGGVFPSNYQDVLSLKGVGEYTAAAICSFAYNLPYAVVDGNVFRVLSRLFDIETPIDSTKGKKEFSDLASKLLDSTQASIHNQAIMEFGALQCKPRQPDCFSCVLQAKCWAYAHKAVEVLPVKEKKTKVSARYFNYIVFRTPSFTFLNKRKSNDVWKNLYEFPLIETEESVDLSFLIQMPSFKSMTKTCTQLSFVSFVPFEVKHVLSHRVIYAKCYVLDIAEDEIPDGDFIQIPVTDLKKYPVSRLTEIFQKKMAIF